MADRSERISLVEFHPDRSVRAFQAIDLGRLMDRESSWAQKTRPKIYKRFRNPTWANLDIQAMHDSPQVRGYVVKKYTVAIGLARIVFDQAIEHPVAGKVEGDWLDYWLSESVDEDVHSDVGVRLIAESEAAKIHRLGEDDSNGIMHKMFTTVAEGDLSIPKGLTDHMATIGEPAELKIRGNKDSYDIARGGIRSQVYATTTTIADFDKQI